MILGALTAISVLIGLYALVHMCLIDLKIRILPNRLNALLALAGVGFHSATLFAFMPWWMLILGALFGGGVLYTIRAVANRIYGMDTIGLGDVKLLAAGGVWLGAEHIMMALSVGAFAGLFHGLGVMMAEKLKTGTLPNFRGMTIPAGPGFAAGLLIVGLYQYWAVFLGVQV